jgi:hypothetical protein
MYIFKSPILFSTSVEEMLLDLSTAFIAPLKSVNPDEDISISKFKTIGPSLQDMERLPLTEEALIIIASATVLRNREEHSGLLSFTIPLIVLENYRERLSSQELVERWFYE